MAQREDVGRAVLTEHAGKGFEQHHLRVWGMLLEITGQTLDEARAHFRERVTQRLSTEDLADLALLMRLNDDMDDGEDPVEVLSLNFIDTSAWTASATDKSGGFPCPEDVFLKLKKQRAPGSVELPVRIRGWLEEWAKRRSRFVQRLHGLTATVDFARPASPDDRDREMAAAFRGVEDPKDHLAKAAGRTDMEPVY